MAKNEKTSKAVASKASKLISTFIVLLMMSANCAAVTSQAGAAVSKTPEPELSSIHSQPELSSIHNQLDHLEGQFQIVREYNDDFLSVITWGLSSIIGIAFVLIGLNWLQSTRVLKNEFDGLKKQVEGELAVISTQLSSDIDKRLDGVEKQLKTIVSKVTEDKLKPIRGRVDDLHSGLKSLEFKSLQAEAKGWLERTIPIPANAISTGSRLILCAISTGNEYYISESIDIFNDALKAMEAGTKNHLEAQVILDIETILKKLPDKKYENVKDTILSRLKDLH